MITTPMYKVLEARSKFESSVMPLYVGMLSTELRAQTPILVGDVSIDLTNIFVLWQHWEEMFGLGQIDRCKVIQQVLNPLLDEQMLILNEFTLSNSTLLLSTEYVCSER